MSHNLRVPTKLSDELEDLVHRTIGCLLTVHRELGPGLLESVYDRATAVELKTAGIRYEQQVEAPVLYRGQVLCIHRLDFVVERALVLELKSVERLLPVHHAQVLTYERISHLPVGLLVNFNVPVLRQGIRRIVL